MEHVFHYQECDRVYLVLCACPMYIILERSFVPGLAGELSQRTHRARASEPEAYVEAVLIRKKDKRQARMKAWFFGTS